MADSSDEDEQKVAESNRMWVESQPGPSRCQPSRQGYCGYCRVLYSNLDQHLSSLRHLDSVRASARGSTSSANQSKRTLLERFLQDVLQHHPHRYNDSRPSHHDLPSVSTPLRPRQKLDELGFHDDDSQSLGTREHFPSSSDASCQPANQEEDTGTCSQSGEGLTQGAVQERLSVPIRQQERGDATYTGHRHSSHTQAPPPCPQAPPSVHRKAHRKTDRRKTSDSSSSVPPPSGPRELRPCWEVFPEDHVDPLNQTIEEVIQMYCHGNSSATCQQEETESFHFSLPLSLETQSDDWDSPMKVVLEQTHCDTPVHVSSTEGRDLSRLMDVQVDLEDLAYSNQLDSALHSEQRAAGRSAQDQGFWTLPIEEVLPAPKCIPESFRGKTWTQIEKEDEEKVERLVQQFRGGRFICYFDSESLARYGRRSENRKELKLDAAVPPLLDHDEGHSVHIRRRRRGFRVTSRCQVVKVSHGTQTVQLVVPTIRQQAVEAPALSAPPPANREAEDRTPESFSWCRLPPSYCSIITPLQPRTSLVYLLCSPAGPTPTCTPAALSAHKRCRKKKRPVDLQGLKVKYKRCPVRFYDLSSNRILKTTPRGLLWRQGSASSGPPPCVRQLFRSLSPDLNTEREAGSGSSRVKGQRSSDTTSPVRSRLPLGTLTRDAATDKHALRRRGRTSQAPPPVPPIRLDQGRGGRERTRLTKRRARTLPPRRSGLRRTSASARPATQPLSRRGKVKRGRGCERAGR